MENFKEKKYTKSESYEPTNQEVSEGVGENLLQLIGFIPVIGEIADIILIIKYYREDRKIEAGLMLFALIPTFGDFIVKPFLRLGKAAGAFKTSATFLKYLSDNPAAKAAYSKIGKQLDNPQIAKLVGQVNKVSPGNATILKNAQNLQKGLMGKVQGMATTATKTLERGVGKSVKQNFQNQALQRFLVNTGGKAPSNFISRWWNVVYGGRMMRKNVVRKLILGSNLLGTFGFPNIQTFENFMRNPGDNPELAEKLLKDPEFAKIYNNSVSGEEKSSLEQSADNSADKSPGLVDGAMDGFKGMVGLSLLKSFARFV
jgi:hypothetical protein